MPLARQRWRTEGQGLKLGPLSELASDFRATPIAYPNRLRVNRQRPIHPQGIANNLNSQTKTAAPYGAAVGRFASINGVRIPRHRRLYQDALHSLGRRASRERRPPRVLLCNWRTLFQTQALTEAFAAAPVPTSSRHHDGSDSHHSGGRYGSPQRSGRLSEPGQRMALLPQGRQTRRAIATRSNLVVA